MIPSRDRLAPWNSFESLYEEEMQQIDRQCSFADTCYDRDFFGRCDTQYHQDGP